MSKRGIIFNRRGSHFTSHSSCIITLFLTKVKTQTIKLTDTNSNS
jgi:hypothetical protein